MITKVVKVTHDDYQAITRLDDDGAPQVDIIYELIDEAAPGFRPNISGPVGSPLHLKQSSKKSDAKIESHVGPAGSRSMRKQAAS